MNKIKLPLRVWDDVYGGMPFWVIDSNGKHVGYFPDKQTAKLIADCFEAMATRATAETATAFWATKNRAAEAVEG